MHRLIASVAIGGALAAITTYGAEDQQAGRTEVAARIEVLPVAGDVYLLAGSGTNVVVQAAEEGALIVDTSTEAASEQLIAEVRKLTTRPIRYVINTNADPDHIRGNERVAAAGLNFATPVPNLAGIGGRQGGGGGGGGGGGAPRPTGAQIYAHEEVMQRLSAPTGQAAPVPFALLPTDTFFTPKKTLSFNGEAIELQHLPSAHSDGDLLVWFRRSDVIAAGDVYTPDRFPMIDLSRGGSVQGLIDALNRIIDITVPRFNQQGGTLVIPGHGRISNESDVVEYRDMATIVRDRIQRMIDQKMTLEQVRAANPVLDYEGVYGRNTTWTTSMFVEAMYRDLNDRKGSTGGKR
jgi:glyoxylase-like metal-dependent hydrolase (beta-lactamase superfamily II)